MNKMSFCGSSGGFDWLLCCVNGDWWGLVVAGSRGPWYGACGWMATDVGRGKGLAICFGHF